ncbi:MAG: UDP-N-acetylmuramoyl-tripeptide--D-alanyl-D-alanine ligase [Clostridia bacterium]|nr:UDP-N-acetylmuramoyl-tripeptide--D-alanyl-D-alanine ligase [Clostridia bacterium]
MKNFLLLPLGFTHVIDIYMLGLISVISTILTIFAGYKLLQVLQLTGYKINGFVRWFKETKYSYFSRLFMLSFLSVAAMLMTNVLLKDFFVIRILNYVSILFYFLFATIFVSNLYTARQKTPLVFTKRMTRFLVVYAILILIFTVLFSYIGFMFIPYLSYGFVGIIPIILPGIVFIAYYLTYPFEKLISIHYLRKAKKKLAKLNLKVIGITGSYGKTSVKNILGTILEEKFKVCVTPASFNTPLGLSKTILKNLKSDDEVFIAEMGAKQRYDIKELCGIVQPDIGVITGVGNQHLLTFGNIDNIIETKGELAEFVSKNNGDVFISTESDNAKKLAEKYDNAVKINLKSKDSLIVVSKIKVTKDGSEFDLSDANKTIHCKTVLLGKHNISNILLSANVAYKMGLSLELIANAIAKLKPVPHRLELVKSDEFYTILDDAYNSSVEGSKAAIEVLSHFKCRKIVVTPGMVELGEEQYDANFEFGHNLSKVADIVIIDYAQNFEAISSGLIQAGFDEKNIIQTATLSQSVKLLMEMAGKDDLVLFENDLPDNYS